MPVANGSSCFNTSTDVWQAKDSDVLVDGCLFEGNYANNKGGAIHHENKHISVIGSVFYNNVVGSESEEESEWCHACASERVAPSLLGLALGWLIPYLTKQRISINVYGSLLLFDPIMIPILRCTPN